MTSPPTRPDGSDETRPPTSPGPASQVPVIQCRGLSHCFGAGAYQAQALCDVNLTVHAGEMIAFAGPSGSGKSTLLSLIGGLLQVQEGSLTVIGKELATASLQERLRWRQQIGFIFQGYELIPSLTAAQNVALALRACGVSGREQTWRVEEVFRSLGLDHRQNYRPVFLSAGEKQRVVVARALVRRPSLILADEPTAALDWDSASQLGKLFRKLSREGDVCILLATHDSRLHAYTDRVIEVVDGRIVSAPG